MTDQSTIDILNAHEKRIAALEARSDKPALILNPHGPPIEGNGAGCLMTAEQPAPSLAAWASGHCPTCHQHKDVMGMPCNDPWHVEMPGIYCGELAEPTQCQLRSQIADLRAKLGTEKRCHQSTYELLGNANTARQTALAQVAELETAQKVGGRAISDLGQQLDKALERVVELEREIADIEHAIPDDDDMRTNAECIAKGFSERDAALAELAEAKSELDDIFKVSGGSPGGEGDEDCITPVRRMAANLQDAMTRADDAMAERDQLKAELAAEREKNAAIRVEQNEIINRLKAELAAMTERYNTCNADATAQITAIRSDLAMAQRAARDWNERAEKAHDEGWNAAINDPAYHKPLDEARAEVAQWKDKTISAIHYATEIADHAEACGIVRSPAYDLAVQRVRTVRECDTPIPGLIRDAAQWKERAEKAEALLAGAIFSGRLDDLKAGDLQAFASNARAEVDALRADAKAANEEGAKFAAQAAAAVLELTALKARKVKLPPEHDGRPGGMDWLVGFNNARSQCADAIRAAGVEVV